MEIWSEAVYRLSKYQLVHCSSITLVMRLPGGCCSSSRLTPIKNLISVTYDKPDVITLDDTRKPRAKMFCGHVIS